MNRMEQGIASIPRQTVIRDQPHMLAYITPAEAMLLKQNGGSGLPSHGGVPEFGLWSSTFGGGNSFEQSMQNTFGGEDGGSYKEGEWQGNDGYSTGHGVYKTSEPANIPNPEQSSRNAAARNAAIPNPVSSDRDEREAAIRRGTYGGGGFGNQMVNLGVNMGLFSPVDASSAPPTMAPINSSQPEVPARYPEIQARLGDTQAEPAAGVGFTPMDFAKPKEEAYTFQELLGMYQNPYV